MRTKKKSPAPKHYKTTATFWCIVLVYRRFVDWDLRLSLRKYMFHKPLADFKYYRGLEWFVTLDDWKKFASHFTELFIFRRASAAVVQ